MFYVGSDNRDEIQSCISHTMMSEITSSEANVAMDTSLPENLPADSVTMEAQASPGHDEVVDEVVDQVESAAGHERNSTSSADSPWYNDAKYRRYWVHSATVHQWFRSHVESQERLREKQLRDYEQWFQTQAEYHTACAQWMNYLSSYYTNWLRASAHYGLSIPQRPGVPSCPPAQTQANPVAARSSWPPQAGASQPDVSRSCASTPDSAKPFRKRQKRSSSRRRHGRSRSRRARSPRARGHRFHLDLDCGDDDEDAIEFEMEFTDEMLKFFAHSAKHKQERDEDLEARAKDEVEYVDISQATVKSSKATVLPPSERPGVKRAAEMKQLYGPGAAMIHGMETAMQLTYDRNCDIKQPKLWPHVPLKIQFQ